MTNKFKGLDLSDRVPEELWTEVRDTVQEAGIKTIPKKKKCNKAKWLSEEDLHKKRSDRQRRKGKIHHLNADFQRTANVTKCRICNGFCLSVRL